MYVWREIAMRLLERMLSVWPKTAEANALRTEVLDAVQAVSMEGVATAIDAFALQYARRALACATYPGICEQCAQDVLLAGLGEWCRRGWMRSEVVIGLAVEAGWPRASAERELASALMGSS